MAEEWELYYWPKIAGRAEFVRLIFEEAGVKFKEVNDDLPALIFEGKLGGYPAKAPPLIKKGDFTLAQTPIICEYLGKQFGLYPANEPDEWHARQVNQTIHDFIAEGRLVFHGRGFIESYHTQKEETQPYIDWFKKERLAKWLGYLEKCLAANNGGNGFVIGDKITYVDLGLLHVLRAAEAQFPENWNEIKDIPLLKAFKDRMEARPNISAYLKSPRCRPFEGNSMM